MRVSVEGQTVHVLHLTDPQREGKVASYHQSPTGASKKMFPSAGSSESSAMSSSSPSFISGTRTNWPTSSWVTFTASDVPAAASLRPSLVQVVTVLRFSSPALDATSQVVLQVLPRLVLGFCGGEVVLQEALKILEGRPLLGVLPPAGEHELVQGDRALGGAGHPIAALHLVQDLTVDHTCGSEAGGDMELRH